MDSHLLEKPVRNSRLAGIPAAIDLIVQSELAVAAVQGVPARASPSHSEIHFDTVAEIGASGLGVARRIEPAREDTVVAQVSNGTASRYLISLANPIRSAGIAAGHGASG